MFSEAAAMQAYSRRIQKVHVEEGVQSIKEKDLLVVSNFGN